MRPVGWMLAAAVVVHVARGTAPTFGCPLECCCKVCSDENHDFYPYGPIDGILSTPKTAGGPVAPTLDGDLGYCQIPTWKDSDASFPDTLWWVDAGRFNDSDPHIAPNVLSGDNCNCCRFSGLHSNCIYDPPLATAPKDFRLLQDPIEGDTVTVEVLQGVSLTADDYIELRDSTVCGYDDPAPNVSATSLVNVPGYVLGSDATAMRIDVVLPDAGCYVLCYYHSTLTTPGWYHVGFVDVLPQPAASVVFDVADDFVILEGETVDIVVGASGGTVDSTTTQSIVSTIGGGEFSVFGDRVEMRVSGACGSGGAILESTGDAGTPVAVPDGFEYCNPPLTPQVSREKPLRWLPLDPQDCPAERRLLAPQLVWAVTLPASATVELCYYNDAAASWSSMGTLTIPAKLTQRGALDALYAATQGGGWTHAAGWTSAAHECDYYGVSCSLVDGARVVTGLSLQENGLTGSIPMDFARGDFPWLRVLNLGRNALQGAIPKELGAWRVLSALDLGYNALTGSVPAALRRCPLRTIYLPDNDLADALPETMRSLVVARSVWVEGGGDATFASSFVVPQPVQYITPPTTTPRTARCPTDSYYCPVEQVATGTNATGVAPCGEDGFNEDMCVAIGCCWNPQDTGKPCHTKKRRNFDTYPRCEALSCTMVPLVEVTPAPAPPP
eukprot:TRINITY_DN4574_c1_g5_i1.p1 TRINITY_DN4574_c1_g5~~TRINITY_DN4574_c1_g5_i1.p1  ORF type:complete len:670 (+),score=167.67 TRINITY_DN4574_c1_g5_i1:70-2079(+)